MAEVRRVNTVLWVVQALLAIVFLFSGGSKLVMSIEEMTKDVALPGAFLRFLGVAEMAGGVGLILPGLLGIWPGLTPLAAACLVVIMIGAVVITTTTMGVGLALIPLTVGILAAFVAYGRWRVAPLAERVARPVR